MSFSSESKREGATIRGWDEALNSTIQGCIW
jgi:hypothetical protein